MDNCRGPIPNGHGPGQLVEACPFDAGDMHLVQAVPDKAPIDEDVDHFAECPL